jgi:hypothetical protein
VAAMAIEARAAMKLQHILLVDVSWGMDAPLAKRSEWYVWMQPAEWLRCCAKSARR